MVKKNSIPERWRHLKAVGQRVPGSRFIAFKVPLKGVTNQRVTQNQKFTPKDLITAIRSQNEELGLIIDLTNTERYYTTKDLPKSVQYVKLHTAGLKIPDDATIHQFKRVVFKFLAANSDTIKLIGVHCTTGINRTGYLICRYLIDVDSWKPLHALSAFAQARGHPIEGTVYIEDIVKGPSRSNVGIDLPPTLEEKRAWDTGTYYAPENLSRERGVRDETIKPLLELIPGHEHADFDARGRRPLPLMRSRSDDYQDDYFSRSSDFRGRGLPLGDMNDDLDLRNRNVPSNMSERLNVGFRRRAVDFNPEGRFNPELENRRSFHGSEPRHFMDTQDNYGPRDGQRLRGMPQEEMGYDDRMREQDSPMQGFSDYKEPYRGPSYIPGKMNSAQYDDIEPERRIRPLNSNLDFRERLRRQEFQGMENEDQRLDPREREMMDDSFKGPFNERMRPRNARPLEGPVNRMNARGMQPLGEPATDMINPRNARPLEGPMNRMSVRNNQAMGAAENDIMSPRNARAMEGPMNRMAARNTQALGEAVNDMMNPRDRRVMEGTMHGRMNPRDGRYMDGSVQERFPQRDTQGIRNPMDERMRLEDARSMGGPGERMPPREGQLMEGSMNNRMFARDPRQMEASASERMSTRVARLMDLPLNDRVNPREAQAMENSVNDRIPPRALNRSVNEMMTTRDARSMEGPMNSRLHSRVDRAMEGSMNDQMHLREGAQYERVPLRDTRAIEGLMNEIMYQRDARTRQETMNEPMHPRDARAMEGSMNERMYTESEIPVSKQRDFMNDGRPFEPRRIKPSEESLRGANKFAPYPSLMKPGPPAEFARGPPRHDNRDPRDMLPPQDASRFPTRSRFN